jgi:hypothetical protein
MIKNIWYCRALLAHTCNPSYSGGRDQEDQGLKPARANTSQDCMWKKPFTKKGWWSGSRLNPEFKPSITKKKKKRKRKSGTAEHGGECL